MTVSRRTEKVSCGKVCKVRQQLFSATPMEILLSCESGDIVLDLSENLDGTKPAMTIRITRVLRKWKNPFVSYAWLGFWNRCKAKIRRK